MSESQKRTGGLVVAGSHAPINFQLVEKAFYFVTVSVKVFIVRPLVEPVLFRWNHYVHALGSQACNDGVGAVGFIGINGLRINAFKQTQGLGTVGPLTRREVNPQRIAQRINDGMDFRG